MTKGALLVALAAALCAFGCGASKAVAGAPRLAFAAPVTRPCTVTSEPRVVARRVRVPTKRETESAVVTANGIAVRARIDGQLEENQLVLEMAQDGGGVTQLRVPVAEHEPLGHASVSLDDDGRGELSFLALNADGAALVVVPLSCR